MRGRKSILIAALAAAPLASDKINDKPVVEKFRRAYAEADASCGWYSKKFDIPYINSKLLSHGLELLKPVPHIDLWKTAKYELKLNSNRLASVADFLGVEEKTPLKGNTWVAAMTGDKAALAYVVQHNIQDVIVLEQVYNKMRPLIKAHPNLSLLRGVEDACPTCGEVKWQKRGLHVAQTRVYQRVHCQSCGAWYKICKSEKVKGKHV